MGRGSVVALVALVGTCVAPVSAAQAREEVFFCRGVPATIVGTAASDDPLLGTAGPDVIVGLVGDDRIRGGGGDDLICGGGGADLIRGGRGDDRLYGGADDKGGVNGDILTGGTGNDVLDVGVDARDWTGWNTVDYARSLRSVEMDLGASGSRAAVSNGPDTDLLVVRPGLRVQGSEQDDTLLGSSSRDWLQGGGGDDVLDGRGGDDIVLGERGVDSLFGGDGDDDLSDGPSYLAGEADRLSGGAGDDVLRDLAGTDLLQGGGGNDLLTVLLDAKDGTLTVDGGDGQDRFDLIALLSFTERPVLTMDLPAGTMSSGARPVGGIAGIESTHVRGSVSVVFVGTEDRDDISLDPGSRVHDTAGPLTATMNGGNDRVHGSVYDDDIDGGDGTDHAFGDSGDDRCVDVEQTDSCELP